MYERNIIILCIFVKSVFVLVNYDVPRLRQLFVYQFFVYLVYPRAGPKVEERTGLSKTDIIGIGVGCGTAILVIIIVVLFITIYRKKDTKKQNYTSHYSKDILLLETKLYFTLQ